MSGFVYWLKYICILKYIHEFKNQLLLLADKVFVILIKIIIKMWTLFRLKLK